MFKKAPFDLHFQKSLGAQSRSGLIPKYDERLELVLSCNQFMIGGR